MRSLPESDAARRTRALAVPLTLGVTGALLVPAAQASTPASVHAPHAPHALARPAQTAQPVSPTVSDITIPAAAPDTRISDPAGLHDHHDHGTLVAHVTREHVSSFDMLGVTWDAGTAPEGTVVEVRVRTGGTWKPWSEIAVDHHGAGEGGDGRSSTERDGTAPTWTGDSDGVEVAVFTPDGSTPSGIEVSAIDPGTSAYDSVAARQVSTSADDAARGRKLGPAVPNKPTIISRRQWGADPGLAESCDSPRYGRHFNAVVVHHTVGANSYSAEEAPAIVRGVYAYHTQSRDWCDIGYNFLVSKYGQIFVGRRGGPNRAVRAAHAGNYNVDTTGISMMGNFDTARLTRPLRRAMTRLVAWRLGAAYRPARGGVFNYDRKIARIGGHRDVMSTSCPGDHGYGFLPALRRRVADRMGPKQTRIERYWRKRRAAKGRFGDVKLGERASGAGRFTVFHRGRIYNSKAGVAGLRRGAILKKYLKVKGQRGRFGYPQTGQRKTYGVRGLVAFFVGGRIYWSKRTGAQQLYYSPILKRYLKMGGAHSRLRFPRTATFPTKFGLRVRFQRGTIDYVKATGRTKVYFS